jgi:hypothetical protein
MTMARTLAFGLFFAGLMMTGAAARTPAPPPSNPYTLTVSALVGPTGTDVTVQISAAAGSALPTIAKKLALSAPGWSRTLSNVALTGGRWTARYTDLAHGKALTAHVEFKTTKTWSLCANTVALYRPDLRIRPVSVQATGSIGEQIFVPVYVDELNGDLGASFEIAVSGPGLTIPTGTGLIVNPHGSLFFSFTLPLQSAGTQTVTLTIQNEVPGDYDLSNNTLSFSIEVIDPSKELRLYGGYHRTEGLASSSNTSPEGNVSENGTDGKNESLYVVVDNTKPMSWPLSASVRMYADGAVAFSADAVNVTYTEDFGDGSYRWIGYFPDYNSQLWIVTYPPGSTYRSRFYATRSAADYVGFNSYNGQTTTYVQQSGTFLNATVSSELAGTLTSSLGQFTVTSGLQPITHARQDEESDTPYPHVVHQDVWDSYSYFTIH